MRIGVHTITGVGFVAEEFPLDDSLCISTIGGRMRVLE